MDKRKKIFELLGEVNEPMILEFFDINSDKMLDEKIEVLTDLINGKNITEIPKFYDILELYPADNEMWDL